jgi:ATP-dependent DNA helicase RecG
LQGKRAEYIRQAGFNKLQSEQLVKNFIRQHGRITRGDVMTLCSMTKIQAYRLLKKMSDEKYIEKHGDRKSSYYISGTL